MIASSDNTMLRGSLTTNGSGARDSNGRGAGSPSPAPRGNELPRRRSPGAQHPSPPAILLGGGVNALSVARDLGRMGVPVYAIGGDDALVKHSRYSKWIDVPAGDDEEAAWAEYLLGPNAEHLAGAVLLSCCDAGIRVITGHREALSKRFLLDISDPRAQIEMLDKLSTYEHAAAAGVDTPKFWAVATRERMMEVRDELVYPLVVKPRLSHVFEARFGKKHVTAQGWEDVVVAFEAALEAGIDVMLVEHIPGGDDHLASFFTYVDESGTPLVDYTKRVIRRYPAGMGAACYHVTDHVPQIVEPSKKLLKQSGLRGLANIEFKRDDRDGKYKLIECNGRFAASNPLVTASGCNLAAIVYSRIVGRPHETPSQFKSGMHMWDPMRDFLAFRERNRRGELSLFQWLRSVACWHMFPIFAWTDMRPSLARLGGMVRGAKKKKKAAVTGPVGRS